MNASTSTQPYVTDLGNSATMQVADPRRNDLDALRAVAMLLGIVLHAAMSFIPGGWVVQDSQAGGWAGVFVSAIHGFRMPLFFLISGFFTAMLWRKRGLKSLLVHRFNRIFLPLLICVFTIIPIVWVVSGFVTRAGATSTASSREATSPDEAAKGLALLTAAVANNVDEVKKLLADGVDANATDNNGSTSLHVACLFGFADVANLLLDAGGNPEVVNADKSRPVDTLSAPWGITKFWADLLGVKVDRDQVAVGREAIASRLGLSIDPKNSVAQSSEASSDWSGAIWLLTSFPVFHHLWFLWFLVWMVLGFAVCVAVGSSLRLPVFPRLMVASALRYAWLIPLTAMLQYLMAGFGPDTSIGLIPMPAVFAYYSLFFGFGALYYDAQGSDGVTEKFSWLKLLIALCVLFPLSMYFYNQSGVSARFMAALCSAAYAWFVSFGMMGLFKRYMSFESPTMRYLSDASYWLYIVHIPLIIYFQYVVRDWPITAWLKLPILCLVTSGVLLLSYRWFVRYTPIGTMLNGRRFSVKTRLSMQNNL